MQFEIICDSPPIITNGKNERKKEEEMTIWKGPFQKWDFPSHQLEHAAFNIITVINIISLIAATIRPSRSENLPKEHLVYLF